MGKRECQGEACGDVSIVWDAAMRMYLIRNKANRRIRVMLGSWSLQSEIVLDALESRPYAGHILEYPYSAEYCD